MANIFIDICLRYRSWIITQDCERTMINTSSLSLLQGLLVRLVFDGIRPTIMAFYRAGTKPGIVNSMTTNFFTSVGCAAE